MKQLSRIIIVLFELCQIISFGLAATQDINVVFSPFYINKLDFSHSSSSTPLQIRIASDTSLVFVSLGKDGILVIDETGKNIQYQQRLNDYYINNFDVSLDGKYLVVSQMNTVVIFHQKSDLKQEFEVVATADFPSDISCVMYNKAQNIIIAAGGNGNVLVYDATDMKSLNKLDEFNTGSSLINTIQISNEGRFIYLGCDSVGTVILEFIDQGIDQITKLRKGELQLAAQGKGTLTTINSKATKDNTYVYEIDTWYGLHYANCKDIIHRKKDDAPIQLTFKSFWPFLSIIPTCTTMILSNDDNFIMVGARSQGIFIFDNRDKENIKYFQLIQIESLVLGITMSRTQEYVYLSNSNSIFTFTQDNVNLNDSYPNLFNVQQAKEIAIPGNYKWRCLVDSKNDYFIGVFDLNGLFIIPYYGNPYNLQIQSKKVLDENPDSADIDPTEKYLIFPTQLDQKLVKVYQIAPLNDSPEQQLISIMNPVEVTSLKVDTIQISEVLIFSFDRKYAVATYSIGILLLDVANLFDMKVLYFWQNKPDMQGENQGAAITKDNKWILSTIRLLGLYVLNAENKTDLVLADLLTTFGGESVIISQLSNDYAYLIDGVYGFAIVDLTGLPKLSVLARVQLQGWSVMCMLIQDEKFALITTMEYGMLSLIDMQDKKHPLLISTFRYGRTFGNAVCGPKNEKYIFITTPQSIITLPLVSTVKIHTDVSEIFVNQINGIQKIQKLNKLTNVKKFSQTSNEFTFMIGQQIQFNFAILYPQHEDMVIVGIKQYKDGKVLDLPSSYMSFDQYSQKLLLNVCKEQLDSTDRFKPKLNTFLINIAIPILQKQFEYSSNDNFDKAITTPDQALLILNHLQEKSILDQKYIVTSNFDSTKKFSLDSSFLINLIDPLKQLSSDDFKIISEQLLEKIKLTLMLSQVVNPVKYYVVNSLNYDLIKVNQFIVSEYSSTVTISLKVEQQCGKFVRFNYLGVQPSFSEEQDQITINGNIESVDRIFQQKILFSNSTILDMHSSTNSKCEINVQIFDNLNYPISFNMPINQFDFIQLKERIKINEEERLQKQINSQFPDSSIDIETDISFSFSQNSFIVTNSSEIKYQIQYRNEDNVYCNVTAEQVIQFYTDQKVNFRGAITSDNYREIYHFKVIASDGYTSAEDLFTLKVYGIPFFYVFNILLKVLGPLLALLGLYRKRCIFYNMIFKNTVTFHKEIVVSNSDYKKQIVLLGKTLQDSKMITHILFAKINSINQKSKISKQIHTMILDTKQHIVVKGEHSPTNSSQHNNDEDAQLNNIQQDNQIIEQEYEAAKKLYHQQLYKNFSLGEITNSKKIFEQITQMKAYIPMTQAEKRYLRANGSFSMSQIIKDIYSLHLLKSLSNSSNLSRINDYSTDLKNVNSRIYRAVRASAARYFMSLDKKTQLVYEFIKSYCYNNLHKSVNDWYKAIVNIHYKSQKQSNKQYIVFPNIEIKADIIFKILSSIKLIDANQILQPKSFDQLVQSFQLNKINVNLFLIKEVIIADVLGFSQNVPTAFQPSIGESIHLHAYEIKQIVAFKKINSSKWLRPILKFFNLEYANYGVSKNIRLPSWIYLDQKHGMITFEGVPQTEDIDEILIRIYDITGYIIKQFILKVVPEQINSNNNNNYSVPDEQNYTSSRPISNQLNHIILNRNISNSLISVEKNLLFSQRSPILNSSQKQRISNQFATFIERNESPFTSPKQPFSLKQYEFQKKSNAKNIFQEYFNETSQNLTIDKESQSQEIHENNIDNKV